MAPVIGATEDQARAGAGRGGRGRPKLRERRTVRYARLVIATTVALAAFVVVGAASAGTNTKTILSSGKVAVPNEPAPVASAQGTLEIRPGTINVDAPTTDAKR